MIILDPTRDYEQLEDARVAMHERGPVFLPSTHLHDWTKRGDEARCISFRLLADGTRCRVVVPYAERHRYAETEAPDGWHYVAGGLAMEKLR